MQSGAPFPLTLALSPREREHLLAARDKSLSGEDLPALATVLPLSWGEGREGECGFLLNGYA